MCAIQCSKNGSNSFFTNSLQGSHFDCEKAAKSPGMKTRLSRRNSLDISKAGKQSGMWEFDPSHGSHAVLLLVTVYNLRLTGPEMRAFRALSLVSRLPAPNLRAQMAESLRPIPEIFPF